MMLYPEFLSLLRPLGLIIGSCVLVYSTVYNMWDSFENPPPILNLGHVDELGRATYNGASGTFANATVSFVTLPTSNEAFVCVASTTNNIASTMVVPASVLGLVLELDVFNINLCDMPEVALTFADTSDLMHFAASLRGAIIFENKP
ncbi:hypothetical protein C8Q76DRAFT_803943 [Earliella scabrosa]|nr:hypothetical protein C8Q76DRAFT_803943 [Earliella scabrosa]